MTCIVKVYYFILFKEKREREREREREGQKAGRICEKKKEKKKEVEVCVWEFQLCLVLSRESHSFQLFYKTATQ